MGDVSKLHDPMEGVSMSRHDSEPASTPAVDRRSLLACVPAIAGAAALGGCGATSDDGQGSDPAQQGGGARTARRPKLSASTEDLSASVTPSTTAFTSTPADVLADEGDKAKYFDFSVRLFRQVAAGAWASDAQANVFISPLSIARCLAMAQNGADGQTLSQMEQAIGLGVDAANEYLHAYGERVAGRLHGTATAREAVKAALPIDLAESIWIKGDAGLEVKESFLQDSVDAFDAEIYRAPFDDATVKDVNAWVDAKTDGMIDHLLDGIPSDALLYLISALAFDDAWEDPYDADLTEDATFTCEDGSRLDARLMASRETSYLENDACRGFIRPYGGYDFAFVGLLPREGVSVTQLVESLTSEGLERLLVPRGGYEVEAKLPKYALSFETQLVDALRALGMRDAFDAAAADFSRMGKASQNLYVGEAIHKTFIEVNEEGTRAAAVTEMGVEATSALEPTEPVVEEVILDRPFAYLIIDYQVGLPVFMGAMARLP